MPTKNPRINVVLEKPLYNSIEQLAKKEGVSLSLKVRDLVKEALEMEEDVALSEFASEREKTFRKTKAVGHDEAWGGVSFKLRYHPAVVSDDIPSLNARLKTRIRKAIESRLSTAPHHYGEPLRKTLKGYWKLRVGDYRIVFKIVKEEVWILGIIHRKDVYDRIGRRT